MSTFRMGVDIAGLLQSIEADKQAVAESVRPAAQAGAQVLYEAMKANVARLGRKTGKLEISIYQAFSKDNSTPSRANYHIAPNFKKAPHWHLLEFGYLQRYVTYIDKRGNWRTLKREGATGKPPGRKAPQEVKDAYWQTLPKGPKQIAAHPYIRPTKDKMPQALAAIEARFFEELKKRGVTG